MNFEHGLQKELNNRKFYFLETSEAQSAFVAYSALDRIIIIILNKWLACSVLGLCFKGEYKSSVLLASSKPQ